ncbi:phosphatidylinositol 4-phosphate 3-kinase c2 domain-containing subunit alpha-like [Plakobranchus ocellatus]|uniref:Phosphatidylinositol 4-phosphate 3-kinase c2 domain-containing subunit alpha-like n=1 Tax=Plakobranchus ocellatus TaxID=259542 RepID=A0AAV3ZH83_9GAST|nr:phosphatidylinositol 4-phosphate 3-kinase c2 domain-containing subunit alpha-like [Plakobranchus ocellatus]
MASEKDCPSPILGIPPPPVAAPRRRSPVNPAGNRDKTSSSVPGFEERKAPPPPPPIPPRPHSIKRTSLGSGNVKESNSSEKLRGLGKSYSMFAQDGLTAASTYPGDYRHSLPDDGGASGSVFHPDLQGLDFSKVSYPEESNNASSSKPMYPDISHAFSELKNSSPVPPITQPSNYGMNTLVGPSNASLISQNMAVGMSTGPPLHQNSQAWNNQNFYGTSNVAPAAYPSQTNVGYNASPSSSYSMNMPMLQTYQGSGFVPQAGGNTGGLSFPNNQLNMLNPNYSYMDAFPGTSAAYDMKSASFSGAMQNQFVPSFNSSYVPSAVFPPTPSNSYDPEHPIAVAGFDENFVAPTSDDTEARDLINLGFPEKEYLTLDQFDPLYFRARKESITVIGSEEGHPSTERQDSQINFSFGEAFPNVYKNTNDNVFTAYDSSDEHIWTPNVDKPKQGEILSGPIGFEAFDFDAFGQSKFGSTEEEFLNAGLNTTKVKFSSAAYDSPSSEASDLESNSAKVLDSRKSTEKPPRPPSWRIPRSKRYEKLRKRTFIDAESESFCQMVADLKRKYQSTDERTNQGYLVNQMRNSHRVAIQIKVIVHTALSTEPVVFTCDTNALVEHVISHVLYTVSPGENQASTDNFVLKVFDRTEYLCNDLPLAKFDYTHSCLKHDRDIVLDLVKKEEVVRPFLKTHDDDIQMLYFPKEYINADGTAVSQDALTVFLDTFYHEVDALLEHFSKTDAGPYRTQGVVQTTKAICVNLARVETVEINKALQLVEKNVSEILNPSPSSQNLFGSNEAQDKETQDAINVALHCSLMEDLTSAVDQLVEAVKRLVRMYCRTFLTDFFLGSSIEIPHDHLEVVKVRDTFIVNIASAHRIPTAWKHRFDEYKIVCSLYHGTKRIIPDISTTMKPSSLGLCERIYWDEWLQFDKTYLCTLPRESRLCLMLCGIKTAAIANKAGGAPDKGAAVDKKEVTEGNKIILPLGAAAIQLFNEKGYLNQGPQLVPLMMGASSDPIMPSCKTLLPDAVLLQLNLPDFERTIFFPEPLNSPESPSRSFEDLMPRIRTSVQNVMEKEACATLSAEDLEMLWTHRHYMRDHPHLLPRILQAAHSWDWATLSEIYSLLRCWKPLHPMQAFELLLPQFPDLRVRQFAADSLNKIPSDDLVDFLPQMIQGLKFESYHNSPLAKLLLEQACKAPRFAHQFFWLLKGVAAQDVTFKRRYELMFVALASVAGDALYQELHKQEELVKLVSSLAEQVKDAKDKDSTLKRGLIPLHDMLEEKGRLLLPYNPSMEVVGLDMKSCSYFTSNAFPLKLVFKNSNPKADAHYVIYKVGDDLRQDMLTMQMVRIMESLWLQQGLDLKMITFACLATGPKKGIIELITESETLRKIQVFGGVTGSFKDRPIKEWLQKHNPTELEFKKAVENFTASCAGYCVATYVLGVGDRHNDNIMLKQSGHMFHIDFGKFLGDSQMFGSFKRDRVPFVLTSDMAYVINDGGKQGHRFQYFVDLCCQAFNILRRHADLFRSLFILMARSGIPGVTERAVQYVQNALLPGQSEAQATATFTRMIEESMKSVFTQFNFFLHNLAQLKFSSHQEGTLLSFVSKAYSMETDGKIASVELSGYEKRYTPEKHYIFILKVEREGQKVPMYIFRQFQEFVEFRDKLNEMFPLVSWPNFSTRVVIGRSNVHTVAESRKTEIGLFLSYLWQKTAEISQCELVHTFFHPLLRDEQEAEKAKLNTNKPRDPDKVTKLKTKVVKSTSHPTYNELLQYEFPEPELMYRILQVSVWDQGRLMENNFLGAVYITLRELDLSKDNTAWHKLGRIQMN